MLGECDWRYLWRRKYFPGSAPVPGSTHETFFRNVCYKLRYDSVVLKILLLKGDQERPETAMYFYVSGYTEEVVVIS